MEGEDVGDRVSNSALGDPAHWAKPNTKGTFLFDIDDTLTQGHNPELYPVPGGPHIWRSNPGEGTLHEGQDWRAWNAARASAKPNMVTIDALQRIRDEGYELKGVTARTRDADNITQAWLTKHLGGEFSFMSRGMEMGGKSSSVSKKKMLDVLRAQGHNIVGGLEDSESNAQMFNAAGVPHALVGADRTISSIAPGMPKDIEDILSEYIRVPHKTSKPRKHKIPNTKPPKIPISNNALPAEFRGVKLFEYGGITSQEDVDTLLDTLGTLENTTPETFKTLGGIHLMHAENNPLRRQQWGGGYLAKKQINYADMDALEPVAKQAQTDMLNMLGSSSNGLFLDPNFLRDQLKINEINTRNAEQLYGAHFSSYHHDDNPFQGIIEHKFGHHFGSEAIGTKNELTAHLIKHLGSEYSGGEDATGRLLLKEEPIIRRLNSIYAGTVSTEEAFAETFKRYMEGTTDEGIISAVESTGKISGPVVARKSYAEIAEGISIKSVIKSGIQQEAFTHGDMIKKVGVGVGIAAAAGIGAYEYRKHHRPSTARRAAAERDSRPGYIDDPARLDPINFRKR